MNQRTVILRIEAERPQHACRIIEEIINPALNAYGCAVQWPDLDEPEIAVTYSVDDLREHFKARG